MKFAFVVTNLGGGGAEKALLKIADQLCVRGHNAEMFLLEDRIEHALPGTLLVHKVSGTRRSASKGWLGKRLLAWRLAKAVAARGKFDLIVSTLPFADEVSHLARLPHHWCRIANTLSAEIKRLGESQKARRRHARYIELYRQHPLIAVSGGVADDLRTQLELDTRIATIPNPFDFAAIRSAAAAASARPAAPYVVHVGRFSAQKRHDLLLAAWAAIRPAMPLVLLTHPDPALSALIEQHGLREQVIVAGFQPNPYPWMAGAELLVLCSDHEGLPNVLIEALICGTPVISTDCPSGPREILGAAAADCLVPCGDVTALAAALQRALADPPDPDRVDLSPYAADRAASAYEQLAQENH